MRFENIVSDSMLSCGFSGNPTDAQHIFFEINLEPTHEKVLMHMFEGFRVKLCFVEINDY